MRQTFISILVTLALGLVACGQGEASPTPEEDTTAATDGATAQTCEEAFAQVDPDDAAEAIEQSGEALDDTIAACDAEEWMQQAGEAFGITDEEAQTFVEGRCRANPELAHLDACAAPEAT